LLFGFEAKFGDFIRGQKRNYDIDAGLAPAGDFVFEPVPSARARYDC
jgi:hypothetical protein